ncbi:MAG: hypothetical protein ACFFAE_04090 [Candidatus Hodarchaeota archaeon]
MSVILSLWLFNLPPANAAVLTDWGDVVDVNYSLWEDEEHQIPVQDNINKDLTFIYLRKSQNEPVPSKVKKLFPNYVIELEQTYLQQFINELIGMQINQEKEFMIPAEGLPPPYGDFDLNYHIKILAIRYDASVYATEEGNNSDPFKDFYPLLIGGSVVIGGGGFALWRLQSSRTHKSALSEEKMSSTVRAKSIQKDKDKIKELRELTESIAGSKDTAKKEEVKFRPRRR